MFTAAAFGGHDGRDSGARVATSSEQARCGDQSQGYTASVTPARPKGSSPRAPGRDRRPFARRDRARARPDAVSLARATARAVRCRREAAAPPARLRGPRPRAVRVANHLARTGIEPRGPVNQDFRRHLLERVGHRVQKRQKPRNRPNGSEDSGDPVDRTQPTRRTGRATHRPLPGTSPATTRKNAGVSGWSPN